MVGFFQSTFYGNPLTTWLVALLAAAGAAAAVLALRLLVLRGARRVAARTRNAWDDSVVAAAEATRIWFACLLALWVGSRALLLPPVLRETLDDLALLVLLLQAAVWGRAGITAYVEQYRTSHGGEDPASVTTVRAVGFLSTLGLWSLLGLMALDNAGVDITALVAGLGIGGIAVALAVQNILGDLFASLSIVVDKPFAYGDFIVVDEMMGTVERIGLKTTRLRSLTGEQLVFSNSDLLQSRIRNYQRLQERRVVFTLGVVYETSRAQLTAIPGMVRSAVEAQPDVRFDRAHLSLFGPSSLDYEVVFYVLNPDYNLYMDRQQAIYLEILRSFTEAGIDFAYPTQTLHLAGAGATAGAAP